MLPLDEVPTGDADAVGAPASKRVLRSQGRRTMRKLLDAAMVAFDHRGYHATRVNDVVEIAKTSHGTFYLYFSNKEDLLRALVAEAAAEAQTLYDALSTLPAQGGAPQWEDVHGWIRAYSELWTRYAPLFRAWTDLATIDPELVDVIRSTFTTMSGALASRSGPTPRATSSTPMPPAWPRWPCSTASTTCVSSSGNRSTTSLSRR